MNQIFDDTYYKDLTSDDIDMMNLFIKKSIISLTENIKQLKKIHYYDHLKLYPIIHAIKGISCYGMIQIYNITKTMCKDLKNKNYSNIKSDIKLLFLHYENIIKYFKYLN